MCVGGGALCCRVVAFKTHDIFRGSYKTEKMTALRWQELITSQTKVFDKYVRDKCVIHARAFGLSYSLVGDPLQWRACP